MATELKAELLVDAHATLGEGPFWHGDEQRLYWVDIEQGLLHRHDPDGELDRTYTIGCRVGCAAPRRSGGFLLGTQYGFEGFDLETEERTPIVDPEADKPDNRFNDGKCDPAGRFWAGTLNMSRQGKEAALYVLEPDHTVRQVLTEVTTSNGLAWSPDLATMYYIDTRTRKVDAFDYDQEAGTIARRRTVIDYADQPGAPDGMTIDQEGMIWVAHWSGHRVTRWNPQSGEPLAVVPIPVARVTSCAFGGPKLDRLFITTASIGLSEEEAAEQPSAGGLFVVDRPGTVGLAAARSFAG